LGGNLLKDEGTIIVCNALKESKVSKLKELELYNNDITVTGAKSVAAYLVVTAELTSLDVRYNSIAGEGASQLSAAVLTNTKIEVFNKIPVKDMRTDSLTTLDLYQKDIGVVGVMVVAGLLPVMASLTKIDLSENYLGAAGAAALAPAIGASAELTKLGLNGNSLGDDGTITICKALSESKVSKLQELDLSLNHVSPPGGEALGNMLLVRAELTSLDVRDNSINGNGASQLSVAVLGNLKIETFNEIPIKEMRTDSLTELDLKDKGIEVVGGMVLAGLLPVMASLTELNLSGNKINAEGAQPLADALRVNASLTPDVSASAS